MRGGDSRVMVESRITRPRVIVGIATLLGCFSAFQASQFVRFFSERDTPFWVLLTLNLGYWYAWALLVPIVLVLARRFPLDRERWMRCLPVHLGAVLVLTFVHVLMAESVRYGVSQAASEVWMKNMTWWTHVTRTYFYSFDWEMMTYWAIIGFWHATAYYRVAQNRTLRASRLETRLAEAQLQALQRQLHPHFLFNTLNAISALMHRDVEAADQMLARLSDLLRIALDMRGAQEVALKDELEFLAEVPGNRAGPLRRAAPGPVRGRARDARRPGAELNPAASRRKQCPARRGRADRARPDRHRRPPRRDEPRALGARQRTGPAEAAREPATGKGVGLANTRSRLEHLYGASQQLSLTEPPEGGLTVTVMLPFRDESEVAEIVDAEEFTEDIIKGVA